MRTLQLPVREMQSQWDVLAFLEQQELKEGDKLDIILESSPKTLLSESLLFLLAVVLLTYFNKEQDKRIAHGERMLEDLLSKGSGDLEGQLEAAYGIKIEFIGNEDAEERADWNSLSLGRLASSYEEDEPDYSDAVLKEPNPDYKP